jgi:hypothetical protein
VLRSKRIAAQVLSFGEVPIAIKIGEAKKGALKNQRTAA